GGRRVGARLDVVPAWGRDLVAAGVGRPAGGDLVELLAVDGQGPDRGPRLAVALLDVDQLVAVDVIGRRAAVLDLGAAPRRRHVRAVLAGEGEVPADLDLVPALHLLDLAVDRGPGDALALDRDLGRRRRGRGEREGLGGGGRGGVGRAGGGLAVLRVLRVLRVLGILGRLALARRRHDHRGAASDDDQRREDAADER